LVIAASIFVPATATAQSSPPANDSFAGATEVTGVPATFTATMAGATTEVDEPFACDGVTNTVWYKVQLDAETPIEANVEGYAVSMAVYTGSQSANLRRHDCSGYDWKSASERVGFWALPGKAFYFQIGTTDPSAPAEFTLTIERFDEPEPFTDEKPPCETKAFKLFVEYNIGPPKTVWYLNAASVPGYLKLSEVKRALRESLKNISASRNDCGLADKVSIRTTFGGAKSAKASTCYNKIDKLHVIQFKGNLEPSGRACGSVNADADADIWLNAERNHFTTDPLTTLCREGVGGDLDLESLVTHELGHVFGLDHPDGTSPANLTMFWAQRNCSSAYRTLGLGDVLGLRRLY